MNTEELKILRDRLNNPLEKEALRNEFSRVLEGIKQHLLPQMSDEEIFDNLLELARIYAPKLMVVISPVTHESIEYTHAVKKRFTGKMSQEDFKKIKKPDSPKELQFYVYNISEFKDSPRTLNGLTVCVKELF